MKIFSQKICVVEIFVLPLHPQTRKALANPTSNQDTNQGGNDCLWIGEEKVMEAKISLKLAEEIVSAGITFDEGTLAQVVEQWTENPCVLGSTPRGTTQEEVF